MCWGKPAIPAVEGLSRRPRVPGQPGMHGDKGRGRKREKKRGKGGKEEEKGAGKRRQTQKSPINCNLGLHHLKTDLLGLNPLAWTFFQSWPSLIFYQGFPLLFSSLREGQELLKCTAMESICYWQQVPPLNGYFQKQASWSFMPFS